jgi:hypothetical protein
MITLRDLITEWFDIEYNRRPVYFGEEAPDRDDSGTMYVFGWWMAAIRSDQEHQHVILRSFEPYPDYKIYPYDKEFFNKLKMHIDLWIDSLAGDTGDWAALYKRLKNGKTKVRA